MNDAFERDTRSHQREWLPFEEARAFVRSLGLPSYEAWRAYCIGDLAQTHGRRPANIPAKPEGVYRDEGWQGVCDWLGIEPVAASVARRVFRRARSYARSLGLTSEAEWRAFCAGARPELGALPEDVATDPAAAYPGDWAGWENWLGVESRARPRGVREYMSFPEAKAFVQALGLRNRREWEAWLRGERPDLPPVPEDLPRAPRVTYYAYGWKGLGDFLGTGTTAPQHRKYLPFREAHQFALSLGLSSQAEWFDFLRGGRPELGARPDDIPSNPNLTYRAKGWKGWGHWLRTQPGDHDEHPKHTNSSSTSKTQDPADREAG